MSQKVTIFESNNFTGRSQELAVGYTAGPLAIGNDVVSSVKVPAGLKVTLYEHGPGNGRTKVLTADAASLPDFNDITSNILVEELPAVWLYEHNNYGGRSQKLVIGYNAGYLAVGNDVVSSVKVPAGLKVTLYEHAPGNGRVKILTADTPSLPDFNDITSNVLVESLAESPAASLPARIALRATINGKFVCAENAGALPLIANRAAAYAGDAQGKGSWEIFEAVPMATNRIALRATINGKFVSADRGGGPLVAKTAMASAAADSTEVFEVKAMGTGRIALRAVCNNRYVCAEGAGAGALMANRENAWTGDAQGNGSWEIFEFKAM
jgi:hypothetical protein